MKVPVLITLMVLLVIILEYVHYNNVLYVKYLHIKVDVLGRSVLMKFKLL